MHFTLGSSSSTRSPSAQTHEAERVFRAGILTAAEAPFYKALQILPGGAPAISLVAAVRASAQSLLFDSKR
jgi:hypothetical protein